MNKSAFIREFAAIVGVAESELTPAFVLSNSAAWDSMGKMAALTLIDTDAKIEVPFNFINTCKTFGDVLTLVEPQLVGE